MDFYIEFYYYKIKKRLAKPSGFETYLGFSPNSGIAPKFIMLLINDFLF